MKKATLASAVGIVPSYLTRLEAGDPAYKSIGHDVLRQLAAVLGVEEEVFEGLLYDRPLPEGPGPDPEEEARAALVALKRPEWAAWRPVWETALFTGLRIGEVRGLRRQDCDLPPEDAPRDAGGWLHVRQQITRIQGRSYQRPPKGRRPRDVPVPPPLVPVLRAHLASHEHELVFAGDDGQAFSYDRCRRALAAFAASIGVDALTPHELRHSAASIALASGMPLSYVSWFLGHADQETSALYLHPLQQAQQDAAGRFAAYLTGEPPPK